MAYQSEIDKLERRWNDNPGQYFAPFADQLRKAGEFERALEIVRAGLEARPGYVSGHIVLGRCLVDSEQLDEASRVFEQVVELDAENIIALRQLSEISERSGDIPGAVMWMERLLEVDPFNEANEELERLRAAAAEAAPAEDDPSSAADAGTDGEDSPEEPAAPGFEPTSLTDEETTSPEIDQADGLQPEEPPTPADLEPVAADLTEADSGSPTAESAETIEGIQTQDDFVEKAREAARRPSVSGFVPEETLLGEEVEHGGHVADESVGEQVSEDPDTEPGQPEPEPEDSSGEPGVPGTLIETPALTVGSEEGADDGVAITREEDGLMELEAEGQADEEDSFLPNVGMAGDDDPTGMSELVERASQAMEQEPSLAAEPEWVTAPPPDAEGVEPSDEVAAEMSSETGEADDLDPDATLPLINPPDDSEGPAVAEDDGEIAHEPELVVTETMAVVYEQQGHLDRAREVYVKLLERSPDNEHLQERLTALDGRLAKTVESSRRQSVIATVTGGESARARIRRILGIADNDEVPSDQTQSELPVEMEAATASPERGESFDDFYGEQPAEPADESEPPPPSGDGESDEAFRQWLRGLKSE